MNGTCRKLDSRSHPWLWRFTATSEGSKFLNLVIQWMSCDYRHTWRYLQPSISSGLFTKWTSNHTDFYNPRSTTTSVMFLLSVSKAPEPGDTRKTRDHRFLVRPSPWKWSSQGAPSPLLAAEKEPSPGKSDGPRPGTRSLYKEPRMERGPRFGEWL